MRVKDLQEFLSNLQQLTKMVVDKVMLFLMPLSMVQVNGH